MSDLWVWLFILLMFALAAWLYRSTQNEKQSLDEFIEEFSNKSEPMECENCHETFDPIRCRWRCPECGWKHHCCEMT